VNATVLIVSSSTHPNPQDIETTRSSIGERIDDIVIVDGGSRASATLLARHEVVLTLEAGETVEEGSWVALERFVNLATTTPKGLVCLFRQYGTRVVRSYEQRLVRPGQMNGGGSTPLPITEFVIRAKPSALDHTVADIVALETETNKRPKDVSARLRLASALIPLDAALAVEHANLALNMVDIESLEGQSVAITLADALATAGMYEALVDLAEAGKTAWPIFTELRFRQALAFEKLGRFGDMLRAFEECLQLGEDEQGPGTIGAGTFLPLHHLGVFAESRGDKASAKSFYERALRFYPFQDSADRLRSLFTIGATDPPPVVKVKVVKEEEPAPSGPVAKAKPLTIVACIPGREFSGRFFDAWNEFAEKCRAVGVNLIVSRRYDAVVYYARNKVAGGDVRRGAKQAPWGGEIDYDYMLWIDSDVVFRFEDFQRLLSHKVEMVAGLYLMADNTRYSAVETMNEEIFKKQGEFEFLTPASLAHRHGLVKVDYCGFGFVLVRKGVFERLEYPWFRPLYMEMGECTDFTSEDVGFCMMAKRAGIEMMIDPDVVVGHEKAVVLAPPPRTARKAA
jgi:tetratricopeptide (TPR) repeat protein